MITNTCPDCGDVTLDFDDCSCAGKDLAAKDARKAELESAALQLIWALNGLVARGARLPSNVLVAARNLNNLVAAGRAAEGEAA